ncbi:MAG: ROK family transcriptional regulator [Streptosporangiaceae bacterium]|nr:ROK family transcriptional regulator [Streptosporangiaceae bacterium]
MTTERHRSTVRDLRRDNRSALLWALFFRQPCTRQELSDATGLSAASVSTAVRELIGEGIVTEAGPMESDGGRPRVLLRMNPGYGRVIGIDVGETRVSAEMFDLTMARLARADHLLNPRKHGVDLVVDRIASCLDLLLDDAGSEPATLIGVGIGVPGAIERDRNGQVLVHAQPYGWDAVPLERLLRDRLGHGPGLLIDNGAKAMGQAELWFGAERENSRARTSRASRPTVVCLVGSGVGASIVADDRAVAAEWGHTIILADGRPCRCGSRGCLEAYVGAEAILERYGLPVPDDDEEAALTALITASSARADEIREETATFLGIGIANLINLLNPDRVIIGGWAGLLLAERLMPTIREAARRHSLRNKFSGTTIERGTLGLDAVALGAATLPIERFFSGKT